jgi:hypothetical protein
MVGPLQSSLLSNLTALAFVLHVGGGTVGLFSGTVAALAPKGGPVHRKAGTVFFASMLVMAVFAGYLAVVMPGQIVNLFGATFTLYLFTTAWMTARRSDDEPAGLPEKIALAVIVLLGLPFAVLSFQLATGLAPFLKSAVALKGPVLIAIYSFTAVIAIAAISDARMVFAGGIAGPARIARHLWRMCVSLTLAAGSAFTNGLPRLLPRSVHVPELYFFLPQFLPLILLVIWMIRVRVIGWQRRDAVA